MTPALALRFLRCERGASAAEFALVLPAFLLMIFSTIYLSFALGALSSKKCVTEQTARCHAVNKAGTCTAANISTYAVARYKGPALSGLSFTASTPSCGKQVSGSGTFSLYTGLGVISVPLSASACYPAI
jgi:Flp pilus assembly protein TadG